MGGRGSFSEESQSIETFIFSTVGFIPNFEGNGTVKVILHNNLDSSAPTPTFCNTADTIYVSISPVRVKQKIVGYEADHIYYHRGHYLYKSVDLAERGLPHFHYWSYNNGSVVRRSHDKNNQFFNLSLEDYYYQNQCSFFARNFLN